MNIFTNNSKLYLPGNTYLLSVLEIALGTRAKVRMLCALAAASHPLTRNELARAAGSGMRSTYEQVEELVAIGVLREVGDGPVRLALDEQFPLHADLRNLLLMDKDLLRTAGDILEAVDRICGDSYYIGAFTAARARITPIDYDPPIYIVNLLDSRWARLAPRLRALGKLDNVLVGEKRLEQTGEVSLLLWPCPEIPSDAVRGNVQGAGVWLCSVERGVVECLARKTPFSEYGAYLAILQNRIAGALDLGMLQELAAGEGALPRLLAVAEALDRATGKNLFGLRGRQKRDAWRTVDEKEIRNAVNTVMG